MSKDEHTEMGSIGFELMVQRKNVEMEEREKEMEKLAKTLEEERESMSKEAYKKEVPKSHWCFYNSTIEIKENHASGEDKEAIDDFHKNCKKYPNHLHKLINRKTGEITFYNGGQMLTSPEEKGEVDEDCLVEAIIYLKENNEGKKMKDECYGFMIGMLREGWLGSGWDVKEKKECIKWMREKGMYGGSERSKNIYDYIPKVDKDRLLDEQCRVRWPNWKNFGKNSLRAKGKIKLQQEAIEFGERFHDAYWKCWRNKHRKDDDLTIE